MANITTRSLATDGTTVSSSVFNKGSALTISEMDSNFLNLNNVKLENVSDDFTGELSLKGSGGSATGALRLYDNDDSHYVDLKSPDTITTSFTLKLPTTDGNNNEVLKTDGSGNLSWSAALAGDILSLTAGNGLTGGGGSGDLTLAIDVSDTAITKDEDAMGSNSASHLATQQSIKAYVDAQTHTGEANESSFKTISVSGQDNVVADADDDTLTLAAGSNMTITTTAGSDTITFAATDTTLSLIDEDNFSTNSATRPPSQQSVKAYVDGQTHTGEANEYSFKTIEVSGQTSVVADADDDTLTLVAGSNMTITTSADEITLAATSSLSLIDEDNMSTNSATRPPSQQSVKAYVDGQTHTGEANESSFKTISVSGQDNIVADADDDTLTLVAGSNMTITTTAGTDTITLAATDTILSLIDEDNMATDSATRPPSQQSVKAYSDDATQTLTNKTLTSPNVGTGLIMLEDATITFEGATANDFETILEATDPTADGTLKIPTIDGTDTLVGKATTDTLTNKTLTTPTINGATLSGTLGVASNGDLIVDTEGSYTFKAGVSYLTWVLAAAKSLTDGETLTQATSGATAIVHGATSSSTTVLVRDLTGTPTTTSGHTLTGSVSGALSTYIANLNQYYGTNIWATNDSFKFLQHSPPLGAYNIASGEWGVSSAPFHFQGALSINGTTTPSTNLLYNTGIQIESNTTGWPSITLKSESATANDRFGNVWFVRSGSNSTDAYVVDGDKLGGFYASGYHEGDGNYNNTSAAFYFKAEGDHTATNLGGYMRFEATPSSSETKFGVLEMYGDHIDYNVPIKMGEVWRTFTLNAAKTLVKGETLTQANSSATAKVVEATSSSTTVVVGDITGTWTTNSGDTITGSTTGALSTYPTGLGSIKPSAVANHGFLYTRDVSGTGRVFALDADDTETQISPHNNNGEWEHYSVNHKTGKTVRINMERMIKDIEKLTGKTYIENK